MPKAHRGEITRRARLSDGRIKECNDQKENGKRDRLIAKKQGLPFLAYRSSLPISLNRTDIR
jgi:hypothetical protein